MNRSSVYIAVTSISVAFAASTYPMAASAGFFGGGCFFNCSTAAPQQTVWAGDFTVASDADIETLAGYAEITGKLIISGAVSNVAGLDGITKIGGDLVIANTAQLGSIGGFNKLVSIGGNLQINDNEALTSISGFDALASVGGSLGHQGNIYIYGNPLLTELGAFANIDTLNSLFVVGNVNLEHSTGFGKLSSIAFEPSGGMQMDFCMDMGMQSHMGVTAEFGPFGQLLPTVNVGLEAGVALEVNQQMALDVSAELGVQQGGAVAGAIAPPLSQSINGGAGGELEFYHVGDFSAGVEAGFDTASLGGFGGLSSGFGGGWDASMNATLHHELLARFNASLSAELTANHDPAIAADLMAYLVADFSARATHYFVLDLATQMAAQMSSGGDGGISAGFSASKSVCFATGMSMDVAGYFMAGLDGDHAGQVQFTPTQLDGCGCGVDPDVDPEPTPDPDPIPDPEPTPDPDPTPDPTPDPDDDLNNF